MRYRFAPSPTGHFHLGNVRTALLAWLQARRAGGVFVLRIEDLDAGRVRREYLDSQLRDLEWLGLDWDEGPTMAGGEEGAYGPYFQSQRQALYEQALERLADMGATYACSCSRKEIAAAVSAPHGPGDEGPPYPGRCREHPPGPGNHAIRFRVPDEVVCFEDRIHGRKCYEPAREVGDFVVRRKDGIAAYQLAVVVDDAAMRITEVLRGSDLLASTARQILLYRALGLDEPRWTHVPLMLEAQGDRLAKREGSMTIQAMRARGLSPERIVGWLASTVGLLKNEEPAAARELVDIFDLQLIPRFDTRVTIPDWMTV